MRKLFILLLVLGVASIASAATISGSWTGAALTQEFSTAGNWNGGYVPTLQPSWATSGFYGFNTYGGTNTSIAPIIDSLDTLATIEVRIGGPSGVANIPGTPGYLVITGGSLGTQNFFMIANDSSGNRSGTVNMSGGTLTLGGAGNGIRISGHLQVGHGTNTSTINPVGTLNMSGGLIDAGADFVIGKYYSHGYVYLSGSAVIKANTLKMRPDQTAASALLDIRGHAKVIINGNLTIPVVGADNDLYDWIASGWVTSDGGAFFDNGGEVTYDAVLNQTTIVPEPATLCLLGIGALSLLRRRK